MLRDSLDDLEKNGIVGDWCFSNSEKGIFIRYPISDHEWFKWYDFTREQAPEYNRGDIVHLPIILGNSEPSHWGWDGNKEAPTLTPSINVIGRWHGWLREGQLIAA